MNAAILGFWGKPVPGWKIERAKSGTTAVRTMKGVKTLRLIQDI